jgi:transposase
VQLLSFRSPQIEQHDNFFQAVCQFLDFANHYGFTIKSHQPYRPRTKGKVDGRSVDYVKDNFLNGRSFADFADLNAQALHWLNNTLLSRGRPNSKG